jgi:hypothetical protein
MKPGLQKFLYRIFGAAAGLAPLLLLMFATEQKSQAYTDPGTGLMIWQTLVAGAVGVAFYSRKILKWILPKKPQDSKNLPASGKQAADNHSDHPSPGQS